MPFGPYDPIDLMVSEMSVMGSDAVWGLWKAHVGESQCRF